MRQALTIRLREYIPENLRREIKLRRLWCCSRLGIKRYDTPALFDLESKLNAYLGDNPGVFVELGANDGYSQSNTYFLERHMNWRGILVEPIPTLYRHCVKTRPRAKCYNVACGRPDAQSFTSVIDNNLMSQISQGSDDIYASVRVPQVALSEVIDDADIGRPDFISIDVEGYELEVLAGLDLSRHCPQVLLVETKRPDAVAELVSPWLRQEAQLTYHDYLYLAHE